MNYYFLTEDEKSFTKVLPEWLKILNFNCTRVPDISEVKNNNYILQSGRGVTQLVTKVIFDTIDTLLNNPNKIDQLIIILDTEELTEENRNQQVMDKIFEKYQTLDFDFQIRIFVCNHCFETWLLGKNNLYPASVNNNHLFYPFYSFYNIQENDPERMPCPCDWDKSISQYHFQYFHDLCLYKKIKYRKSKPYCAMNPEYFNGMVERIHKTNDLSSFKAFYDFLCEEAKKNI